MLLQTHSKDSYLDKIVGKISSNTFLLVKHTNCLISCCYYLCTMYIFKKKKYYYYYDIKHKRNANTSYLPNAGPVFLVQEYRK